MSNKRLQDLMKKHNVPPLNVMPPKYSHPIILTGIDDSRLPKQIANDLQNRKDVLEVTYFPPAPQTKRREEYRIKLKSSDDYNVYIFYTSC